MIGFTYEDKRKNHEKKSIGNDCGYVIKLCRQMKKLHKQDPLLKVVRESKIPGITEEQRQQEIKTLKILNL